MTIQLEKLLKMSFGQMRRNVKPSTAHASYQLLSSEVQAHDLFGFFVFSAAAREDLAVTDLPVPEYSRVKFEVFCPTGKDWPKLGYATG